MQSTKIIYWTTTILFAGFMLFSAIPNILITQETLTIMTQLGFPVYFIPFIGVAKLLGVIAILIPGFARVKEWAYAGLIFDLIGACYSVIAIEGFSAAILPMFVFIGIAFGSYFYYHKKTNETKLST